MRTNVFENTELNSAGSSSVKKSVDWLGGDGWLVVSGFVAATGTPRIEVEEFVPSLGSAVSASGLPSTINADGAYPFSAPEGVSFRFDLKADINDTVSVSVVYLLGTPRT